jgi:hypothetical protein
MREQQGSASTSPFPYNKSRVYSLACISMMAGKSLLYHCNIGES